MSVGARLRDVWRVATLERGSQPGDGAKALEVEALRILAEHGVELSESQLRTLRWLCGWEPVTVADVLDMIVAGRPVVRVEVPAGESPDHLDLSVLS